MKNKSKKTYKFSHTPASSKGLGDYYGTGIRAKLGRMRGDSMGMVTLTSKKLKKPPTSVV